MTATTSDLLPDIKRAGAPLSHAELASLTLLRVERAVGLVGRATLRFNDSGFALSAGNKFALGTEVTIAQPGAGMLLEGTVTGINLELVSRGVPELVVVVDDAAYKLMCGTTVDTYLNGTYTQVLQKIASQHSLRAQIQASASTMEYVLQAGTDLAFLDTACQRLGYSWFVDDGSTLVAKRLALGPPATTLTFGGGLGQFSVRASGLRPTSVGVHGWDPDRQVNVSHTSSASSAGSPPAFIESYTGTRPSGKLSASKTEVADRPPLTTSEASALAGAYLEDWSSAAVVARGTCDVDRAIKPGVTIRVQDAGPTSGDYLVTSVEHVYDQRQFETRFVCGPRRPAGLVDTLGPTPPDPGFMVSGLVIGLVTDAADPDNAGRVKVHYVGISGQVESPWARVVTLGGGPARGAVFNPEVNDEVLVGFEHSDTRRPVVLGGLHSKRNTLPDGEKYVANGKVNYRRITSRKNHMIELADGDMDTQQHVLLKLGTKAHRIRLGADRFDIEVGEGIPLTIAAGAAKFDVNAAGNISIEGKNVTIKADGNLLLQGGAKAALESNGQTQVHGATVAVKADGVGNVEAGGPLALKGATVMVN